MEALSSVSIDGPPIETSPSADRQLYTQVPTWLWLEPGWWEPYEATARAGRVWSTVRATPVSTTWDLGDGSPVPCSVLGQVWRSGMSESSSACTHTYRSSSALRPCGKFDLEGSSEEPPVGKEVVS